MIDWDDLVLGPVMGIFGEGQPGDLSTWPIYFPRSGPSFPLADAVFDREYADVSIDTDSGGEITARKPVLGVRLSLFPPGSPQQSETVYIPSTGLKWVVKDVRPDGHGEAKLMLMVTR